MGFNNLYGEAFDRNKIALGMEVEVALSVRVGGFHAKSVKELRVDFEEAVYNSISLS